MFYILVNDKSDWEYNNNNNNNNNKSTTETRQVHVQYERKQHFRKQCKSYNLIKNNTENITGGLNVLYSKRYGLAYKLVPKIGSTFMIQVFTILKNHGKFEKILSLPRSSIHNGRANQFRKNINLDDLDSYTLMVMARNPYARLYSAYIDKVYILNQLSLCKDVLSTLFSKEKRSRMCKYDISFAQFLEYYLDKGGAVLKGHYGPVLSHDLAEKMCNLENILIVKQETFSEDINYMLKSVNVKGKEYDVIYDVMHSKQTEISIGSIVKTAYMKFSSSLQFLTCLTWKEIAIKLWKSFQIQGYINKKSKFPEWKYKSLDKYKSSHYLIKVIMEEVNANPLTHEEKVRQRNKALLKAYKNVDRKYIRKIQALYVMDFDLFQYSKDLINSLT